MKKFIILAVAILFSSGAFAQGVKIALANTQEIISAMPELSDMEKKIAALNEEYKNTLQTMQDEYNKKYETFVSQQDSLPENIKLLRMQELEDIRGRMDNVYQVAQSDVTKKQQELFAPIQQKVLDAIKTVGTENGYSYILDSGAILFKGNDAIDATPLVKAKLGL
jgi:outer membrane protein